MIQRLIISLGLLFGLVACQSAADETLFTAVSPQRSGLDFANTVQESEELNVLTYQYLYNGGGVAIGDVNNDGRPDIYFSGNMVPNKLYLNQGNLHFTDITSQAGVAGRTKWKTGVSMVDINADGLLDIYVCYSGPAADRRNELFINNGVKNGVPVFTEQAARYGIDAPGTFSTQATFFDMDHDNDLDLLLVNHGDMFYNSFYNTAKLRSTRHPAFGNRLYRNESGSGSSPRFTDISTEAGIDGSGLNFGLSASVSDVNDDGWPDIYVTNDYNEQDFLYLNQQNGKFREVLKAATGHISKFSMGSNIADLNNDRQADIVTLDMLPEDNHRQKLLKGADEYDTYQLLVDNGFHHQTMRNMLQLNQGTTPDGMPHFSEIGQLAGMASTDWSWSPLVGDFDNDGRKDLYITNGYLRDFTNLDFLKFTYQDADQKARASGQQLNTGQLVQQMPRTKTSNYCFANRNSADGLTFENVTKAWGLSEATISTGAAYADLDNDGDLDLVVNNSNDPALLYENTSNTSLHHHYLQLRLRSTSGNRDGIGAKVLVTTAHGTQMQELYPASGFQSSNEPLLHFGLGQDTNVQTLQIIWPDGRQSALRNLPTDTTLTIRDDGAGHRGRTPAVFPKNNWFTDYTLASGLTYTHQETDYVDFKHQSLLPYQLSKLGPFLAQGDVNGDRLADVFVGGNARHPASLFIQQPNGQFRQSPDQPWAMKTAASDMAPLFFDADTDGDLDLFIVRGGVEWAAHDPAYQDQLYLNDGRGHLTKSANSLPDLSANGRCVAAADYDKDGDMDLFIGGRSVPGRFPETDFSYVLRNESQPNHVRFVYASDQKAASLRRPGLVNTAVWADLNADSWPDLIVSGEFMPITVYENHRGQLVDATKLYGLDNTNGLWQKLVVDDVDKDGDLDIVAGNAGLNTAFKASPSEPLSICYGDFDKSGTVDPLICYYIQGKNYPLATLDELANQAPWVKTKFPNYAAYADASLDQILSPEQLGEAKTIVAKRLASSYVENRGNRQFIMHALPAAAQVSVLSGIVVEDVNTDGHNDLILAGNFYPWRVQLGRSDASFGCVLLGNGRGKFIAQSMTDTRLFLSGDIRDMLAVETKNNAQLLIVSRHADQVGVMKIAR